MTDTLAVGNIAFPPLERHEWTFVVPPDPRDAEIADLQRWLEIKQTTADGAVSVARQYQHDLEVAQARIVELEAQLEAANGAGVLVIEVARQRDAGYNARIAELEAALGEVYRLAYLDNDWPDDELLSNAGRVAGIALGTIPAPERDMVPTREELDA